MKKKFPISEMLQAAMVMAVGFLTLYLAAVLQGGAR